MQPFLRAGAHSLLVFSIWISVIALTCFLTEPAIASTIYVASRDASLYGNLDQNSLAICRDGSGRSFACGPTSATNSLQYLQNQYSSVYGSSLVDPANLQATAVTLAAPAYLNCDPAQGGTIPLTEYIGLITYIESRVAKVSQYGFTSYYDYTPVIPTFSTMLQPFQKGIAVDLFLGYIDGSGNRLNGHEVSLTGLYWSDENSNGLLDSGENASISFVNAAGGLNETYGLWSQNGFLYTDYGSNGSVIGTRVETVLSYGPKAQFLSASAVTEAPEPGSLVLMLLAVPGLAIVYRRRVR